MNINDILPDPSKTKELTAEVDNLNKQLKATLGPGAQSVEQLVREQQKWNSELRKSAAEFAKLARAADWRRMVAESGRVGASIRSLAKDISGAVNQVRQFSSSLANATAPAASAFVSAKAQILSFSEAAHPQSVAALAGWMKVLTAEIGSAFTPYIVTAVGWVRSATEWWRGLSDETRGLIAKLAIGATAVLGIGFAFNKTAAAIGTVTTAVKTLGAGLNVLAKNPILLAIAGIGVGIGAIAKFFGGGTDELTRQIQQSRERQSDMQKNGITDVQTFNRLPKDLQDAIKDENKSKIKELGERLVKEGQDEVRQAEQERDDTISGRKKLNIPLNPFTGRQGEISLPEMQRLGEGNQNNFGKMFFDKIIKDTQKGFDLRIESGKEKSMLGDLAQQGRIGQKDLGLGSQSQAQFMALDSVRKTALEKSLSLESKPWEKELLRKQTEMNEKIEWQNKFWERNERRLGRGSGE